MTILEQPDFYSKDFNFENDSPFILVESKIFAPLQKHFNIDILKKQNKRTQ